MTHSDCPLTDGSSVAIAAMTRLTNLAQYAHTAFPIFPVDMHELQAGSSMIILVSPSGIP